jgi:hypothetical protein
MPTYVPTLDTAPEAGNSATNTTAGDVVGNKTDTVAGTSLMAFERRMLEGVAPVYCVTGGAAGVTVTGGAAGYADAANYTEINAGAGVTVASAIVGIALDTPSDGAILGEIDIGTGAGNPAAPTVTIPFEVASDAAALPVIFFPPAGRIAATTRICARMRTAAGAETIGIKVFLKAVLSA